PDSGPSPFPASPWQTEQCRAKSLPPCCQERGEGATGLRSAAASGGAIQAVPSARAAAAAAAATRAIAVRPAVQGSTTRLFVSWSSIASGPGVLAPLLSGIFLEDDGVNLAVHVEI